MIATWIVGWVLAADPTAALAPVPAPIVPAPIVQARSVPGSVSGATDHGPSDSPKQTGESLEQKRGGAGEQKRGGEGDADALPPRGGVAVVCPPQWIAALRPWIDHRRRQGYRVFIVSPEGSAKQIRSRLLDLAREQDHAQHDHAQQRGLSHVVLVGDAEPTARHDRSVAMRSVPPHYLRAKVNVHWGSEPEIASDNPYGDLDGDGIPELAVGRLSVDSLDQLQRLVARILRYETDAARGNWRRRVNIVAGVGGFGPLADTVLEMATKKFLTDGIPPSYSINMTYGSWRSPFCPDPRRFRQATLDRLNEGCLFWVYIGHGQRRHLDRIRVPGGAFPIFDTDDTRRLRVAEGAPIAVLLACYAGAYDDSRDCLAEEMLRAADGPVAVLSGSRVTMPYAMAVMGNALMDEYFRHGRPTLGEIVLHTKRRLVEKVEGNVRDAAPDSVASNRLLLDSLARMISPSAELLDEERLEHVGLFNLLGDPLLQLPRPDVIALDAVKEVRAGGTLELTGSAPLDGSGTLELVCRRDQTRLRATARRRFEPTQQALAAYDEVYRQANDRRWIALPVDLEGGPFRIEVPIPKEARGPCYVRMAIQRDRRYALGATPVYVRRGAPAQTGD